MAESWDLCIIGGGTAGLTVAAGAAQMGAKVVLVEARRMGGDGLHSGCVPVKALLSAAPQGFDAAMHRVRGVMATLARNDAVERLEGLGISVILGRARFVAPTTIEVEGRHLSARRFVIASGARPLVPGVLRVVPHLTSETVFALNALPRRLVVAGGGPLGVEMAQAFRRMGAAVAVIEAGVLLAGEDPELSELARRRLRRLGVALHEGRPIRAACRKGDSITVGLEDGTLVEGSHLLAAAGRRPNLDLGLEAAGIAYGEEGIVVDNALRTSNRRIYAIGEVVDGPRLTQVAGYHAGLVLRHFLFRLPVRADATPIPRVVYGEPELAQVGLTEAEARARHGRIEILRWPLSEVDRAHCDGDV
ncbi:MAG: FAD-dependent oxidoreductase, partial [Rhodospirillales bacterium]|nr:FAD-dependent oxidoreductase [Rhodospirillales bacterium]